MKVLKNTKRYACPLYFLSSLSYLLSIHNNFYCLETTGEDGESELNGYEIVEENTEKLGKDLSKLHLPYLVSKLREILSTQEIAAYTILLALGVQKV
ncbi:MAG: hypothetical protein COW15_13260 [Shewanella sp. CG12_big_fil_rev_8_21_14_0_65_47_15]|nr:MAG: hypothetical protein COW15_13260 [Shewanella sp. CG12_big_fil_rev_8_21_14_0_65_47_15]